MTDAVGRMSFLLGHVTKMAQSPQCHALSAILSACAFLEHISVMPLMFGS